MIGPFSLNCNRATHVRKTLLTPAPSGRTIAHRFTSVRQRFVIVIFNTGGFYNLALANNIRTLPITNNWDLSILKTSVDPTNAAFGTITLNTICRGKCSWE
jgi:hypothetical protein